MTGSATTPLRFRKMHGLGNDFVIIDQRHEQHSLTPDLVRAIGDRHMGVGFDQLAEIHPGRNTAAELIFWNADGSQAGACGNVTRCIADMLMQETGQDALDLRSVFGLLRCRRRADGLVEVDMGAPTFDWDRIPLARACDTLHLPIDLPAGLTVDGDAAAAAIGNPHCTWFVADAEAVDIQTLGHATEHHPLFPERTNVQFFQVLDRTHARMRVWERGVGVTLASGSSSCAATANAIRRGLMDREVTLHLDGGDIHIHWREADGHVLMAGPVAHVFDGTFAPGFGR